MSKKESPQKSVRIDNKTVILVDASIPDYIAKDLFLKKLDLSQKSRGKRKSQKEQKEINALKDDIEKYGEEWMQAKDD